MNLLTTDCQERKEKCKMKLPKYKDEALLVAHLLGGRYGWENNEDYSENPPDEVIKAQVAVAIRVAREIRKQLLEVDKKK